MIAAKLAQIAGSNWVVTDREKLVDYLTDETAPGVKPQAAANVVLVKPANASEVSRVLKLANDGGIPVFPRGGGTGLCGGAIPTRDGIVLSLERMKEVDLDSDNLMAVVGAGVTLGELQRKAEEEGLFFPPHPGDENAQVGGLVACNAGGARAVKYGVMRNYVRGIEVVMPTGEILNLGGKLIKDNTGYSIMHLLIGSEGTLGIITRIILRLYPRPAASATMLVPFHDRRDAIRAVPRILQSGIVPLAIEYMDRNTAEGSAGHLNMSWPSATGNAFLMIVVEGSSEDEMLSACSCLSGICRECNGLEPLVSESKKKQADILKIRSNAYLAAKAFLADALDVAVPPASVGEFMDAIDAVAQRFGTAIPTLGHVGDGNLHPVLLMDLVLSGEGKVREVKRAVYEEALRLGGTMTAEHGLGKTRPPDLDLFLDEKRIALMRGIKQIFDPNGILNPGCILG
ncbi:MAG: FAD-binding oxidoreductase [Dehalococcoidia bacterium]|nr:FAD-binding oxidoreductase [Dehalococcoidia bacterium]